MPVHQMAKGTDDEMDSCCFYLPITPSFGELNFPLLVVLERAVNQKHPSPITLEESTLPGLR